MNLASLLLCLVFALVGYFIHPMVLPNLVEANVVSEAALSDKSKDHEGKDDSKQSVDSIKISIQPEKAPGGSPRIVDEPTGAQIGTNAFSDDIDAPLLDPSAVAVPAPIDPKVSEVIQPVLPDPPATPEPSGLSNQEIVDWMKTSIKAKAVTEFTFDAVVQWKGIGTEQIGGKEYQVGEASYKENTIFGNQTLKAKALFIDGKLVKWVWPITNAEML